MHFKDDMGVEVSIEEVNPSHKFWGPMLKKKTELIETLINHDDYLAELYLEGKAPETFGANLLDEAIRKAVGARKVVPIFCGSALKNKGIQPLMDSIIHFLPPPSAKKVYYTSKNESFELNPKTHKRLAALAFKVVNDKDKGLVTFVRVYAGSLKSKSKLFNSSLNLAEKHTQILRMRADQAQVI